jgi:hypothetical protein
VDVNPVAALVLFKGINETGSTWDFKKGGHQEYQDYGNWHYGAAARILGLSLEMAERAAAYVQWRNGGAMYNPANGVPWGLTPPYGDNPDDVPWIKAGYNYPSQCAGHF